MIKIIENKDDALKAIVNRYTIVNDEKVNDQVKEIIEDVKKYGDSKLFEYTKKFDQVEIDVLKVAQKDFEEAYNRLDKRLIESLKVAQQNIKKYHEKQKRYSMIDYNQSSMLGQLITPIENIGIYIPGGSAAYPSTILMNVIPAQIAGCPRICLVSPPTANGKISDVVLATAKLCGIDEVYQVGGAQAIAALTYGSESISKVDKICGPGNSYVNIAKKLVIGAVGIDMIAGPSEILIIADENAKASYVVADMLSQAEHDESASPILITDCQKLVEEVKVELKKQVTKSVRQDIIKKSLANNGFIILVDDLNQAYEIANQVAPEHLELMIDKPLENLGKIKNAGSIFLGEYAPEALGDYLAGPNHTLPTNQNARFSSALSVDDFIKKSSFIYYTKEDLKNVKDDIIRIANSEGLFAHAQSIKERFGENDE